MDIKNSIRQHLKTNSGFDSYFGFIKTGKCIGEGGTSLVYEASLGSTEFVVKFLAIDSKEKRNRHKAEFFNSSYFFNKLNNCIHYIYAGCFTTHDENSVEIDYILMEKCQQSLEQLYKNKEITWGEFYKVFVQILSGIKSLEKCNIIHRDIKPANILLNNSKDYIIADFGIAHYENAPIDGHTKNDARLANFCFSAPEQYNKGGQISFSTDLFAFAEILYWLVYKTTIRGESGRHLQEYFKNNDKAIIIDKIMHKCLSNNPNDRPQSVSDIQNMIQSYKNKDYYPFPDMEALSNAICQIVPEAYNDTIEINNKDTIEKIVNNIQKTNYSKPLWFNTGNQNNTIKQFKRLENGNYLLNSQEIIINNFWLSLSSNYYDDFILFEAHTPKPYILNGKPSYGIAEISSPIKSTVNIDDINKPYIRLDGKVYKVEDLDYQIKYISTDNKPCYYAISVLFGCLQISQNDDALQALAKQTINKENIIRFKKSLKKSDTVMMYL